MSSVTVRGSATASVTPDRAELSLSLSHLAADAATALDHVAEASTRLQSVLEDHGIGRADWATEGARVDEERQWKNDSSVLVGYRASTALTVTVRDADVVARIIRDAVTTAGAAVRNLEWRVDATNPARRELLGAAAVDARVRATAYAEALDLRLGEVESISEISPTPEPEPRARPMMAAMPKMEHDSAEMSVSGGMVDLAADVYVRFAILR